MPSALPSPSWVSVPETLSPHSSSRKVNSTAPAPSPSPSPSSVPAQSSQTFSILRILTHTSNVSALLFSTFLTVHLASPLAALVGGGEGVADRASNAMLLGRAYYHPLEKPLIYGSIAVHIASAVLKRFIHLYTRIDRKREREQSHVSPLQTDPSSIRSPLLTWPQKTRRGLSRAFKDPVSWTGYMFLPFLIHHILINRIIPASSSFPISNLSPSELDYTFVQHSLNIFASSSSSVTGVVSGARQNSWAFINWTGYLALIGLGMAHITWGAGKTWRWLRWNWFQTTVDTSIESEGDLAAEEIQSKKGKRREWSRNIRPTNTSIYITITTLLILSLIRLDHEGRQSLRFVSGRTIERYDAVYRRLSWLYR